MFREFIDKLEAEMSEEEVDKCVKEWTDTIVGGLIIIFCFYLVMKI